MSETKPKWQSIVDLIIPHPTAPQVLVLHENGTWRLPRTQIDQQWPKPLDRINAEMWQQLGIHVTILGQLVEHVDEAACQVYRTYLCENHSPGWTPPANGQWVGATHLDKIEFASPEQQVALAAHLAEVETGNLPVLRTPWARLGWYAATATWIQDQLVQLGYQVTSEETAEDGTAVPMAIEQVKHWFLACVMRVATHRGYVYFKASGGSPLFAKEASAMHGLACLFPQYVPSPLAIEAAREWMLLADFGPEVGWTADIQTRVAVLGHFGRLQIAAAEHIDELIAIGCLDRRLDKLAAQIDPLFNDATMLAYVSEAQGEQLRALAPKLKAICAKLAGYNVPQTLVHGDMHMGNVARQGGNFFFFDWTDACIAHPFLDMIDILHEKDPALQVILRDAYLAEWATFETIERLLDMWALAYPLCALHQAVSYQAILAQTEPAMKYEMAWAMPFWFGKILEALQNLDQVAI